MSELVIIARIVAVEGKGEEAKKHLKSVIAPTLQEEGCFQYDLHQDPRKPEVFFFYERWESMEHLKAHGASSHIAQMKENTKDCIIESKLNFLSKIEAP